MERVMARLAHRSPLHIDLRAIHGFARRMRSVVLCLGLSGCAGGLLPGPTFDLKELDRTAMLSAVRRIGDEPPGDQPRVLARNLDQSCRNTMLLAAFGAYVVVAVDMKIDRTSPHEPARIMHQHSAEVGPLDFRIHGIQVRHSAAWPFFLREVHEIAVEYDAVTPCESS
jgi:hypothetical protein